MPIIEPIPPWKPCSNRKCWFDLIVLGGLVSGLVFLAFEMVVTLLYSGDVLLPLRLLSMPFFHMHAFLGSGPRLDVIAVGLAVLLGLSILAAYFFVAVISTFPRLAIERVGFIVSACVFGYVLWILGFLMIARSDLPLSIAARLHPGLNGFVGHVFCFGMVLGMYIHRRQEKRRPSTLRVRFRF